VPILMAAAEGLMVAPDAVQVTLHPGELVLPPATGAAIRAAVLPAEAPSPGRAETVSEASEPRSLPEAERRTVAETPEAGRVDQGPTAAVPATPQAAAGPA